jgi:hypothetical protein
VFIQLIEDSSGSLLRYVVVFKFIGYGVDGREIVVGMGY